jgi:hypothetical protein
MLPRGQAINPSANSLFWKIFEEKVFEENYAGSEWPHARRMILGGDYFFFFFAAFFVAKTLTPLRNSCLMD